MSEQGIRIEHVVPKVCEVGEGPHWEEDKQCLTFVDIIPGRLHRYFTATGRHQVLDVDEGAAGQMVSFVVPIKDHRDLYVIGHGRSLAVVEWPVDDPDTHTRKAKVTLATVEGHTPCNRFNDAKCDPHGRLWAGTMGSQTAPGVFEKEKGHLYSLGSDLTLQTHLDKVCLSNGLAWSKDGKTFYYIDSLVYCVEAFDYDGKTGTINNRRCILDFKSEGLIPDIPDGMCVDNNGDLWVACFNGGKVICVDPIQKKVKRKITMPATKITSVCFGGQDYSTLYVTSATHNMTSEEIAKEKVGTFAVTGLGVSGPPPTEFKIEEGLLEKLG